MPTQDELQQRLGQYRSERSAQGLQTDNTDENVFGSSEFQGWQPGSSQQSAAPMTGLQAAAPDGGGTTPTPADPLGTTISQGAPAAPTMGMMGAAMPQQDQTQGGAADASGSGLRGLLGQRSYPNEMSPLAGLRRAY